MATESQITLLRAMLGVAVGDLTDAQLGELIDASQGDLNNVASDIWSGYASSTASLVNISESGSSRSMGDVHKNALNMARYYKSLADEDNSPEIKDRPRTRPIERP